MAISVFSSSITLIEETISLHHLFPFIISLGELVNEFFFIKTLHRSVGVSLKFPFFWKFLPENFLKSFFFLKIRFRTSRLWDSSSWILSEFIFWSFKIQSRLLLKSPWSFILKLPSEISSWFSESPGFFEPFSIFGIHYEHLNLSFPSQDVVMIHLLILVISSGTENLWLLFTSFVSFFDEVDSFTVLPFKDLPSSFQELQYLVKSVSFFQLIHPPTAGLENSFRTFGSILSHFFPYWVVFLLMILLYQFLIYLSS